MWMNGLFIHPACSHIAGAFWGIWRLPCMVACTALKIPATIGRCLLDNATGTFNHLYWLSTTGLAEQTGSIQTTLHTNLPWGMYVLMYNEPLMTGYPQQLHTRDCSPSSAHPEHWCYLRYGPLVCTADMGVIRPLGAVTVTEMSTVGETMDSPAMGFHTEFS